MRENTPNPGTFVFRNGVLSDHARIAGVMKPWWGGRDLTHLLLKQFFIHFNNTIFVLEEQEQLIGFFIGYFSQVHHAEAYIHLVGIRPDRRKLGFARLLYKNFFETCRRHDRTTVRSCTSPINRESVRFHQQMGFQIEPGNDEVNGFPVTLDYIGEGAHAVLFVNRLTPVF